MTVRVELTDPQDATVVLLPSEHPFGCPVCGGKGRVRVSPLRLRVASWPSLVVDCPLRLGSDDLRALLGGQS